MWKIEGGGYFYQDGTTYKYYRRLVYKVHDHI